MCSSHKQKRISYSSYGAEILAAADADDRGYNLEQTLHTLFPKRMVKHELLVDSRSLFETIKMLHQLADYKVRNVAARMRKSFETKEVNIARWIPSSPNYRDVLTERNIPMSQRLNDMLVSGNWDVDMSISRGLDAEDWQ